MKVLEAVSTLLSTSAFDTASKSTSALAPAWTLESIAEAAALQVIAAKPARTTEKRIMFAVEKDR